MHACIHVRACMHAHPMQPYILHPNKKIIKIKASDLYKKQQQRYTSERKTFWLFILPKSYLNLHIFIHMYY